MPPNLSTFLQTESFCESGYDGKSWTLSQNNALEIFYTSIDPVRHSQDLLTEMKKSLEQLQTQHSNLSFLDDGSLEAQLLKKLSPALEAIPLPVHFTPNPEFVLLCQSKFQLDDAEMIFALAFALELKKPLLIPRWGLRILNVNALRSQKKELGSPYYVYIEHENQHRLTVVQKEFNIFLSWNFFKTSGALFRSYFCHPVIQNWLASEKQLDPDNYNIERVLISELLGDFAGPKHRIPWALGDWAKSLKTTTPPQQSCYPLHLLFERILNLKTKLNENERRLYGS